MVFPKARIFTAAAICSLAISFSLAAHGVCQKGQMTNLIKPIKIIPCGHFDQKKKKCTDTQEVQVPIGSTVHVTDISPQKIEIYISYILDSKNGKKYVNQFSQIDDSHSKPPALTCQN